MTICRGVDCIYKGGLTMKVIVLDNYDEVSKEASRLVEEKVLENNELVLGLATGSTPLGLYKT